MKWVLIVWTLWQPHVPVKSVELEYASEQQCLDAMMHYEEKFSKEKSEHFGYTLQCREVKE